MTGDPQPPARTMTRYWLTALLVVTSILAAAMIGAIEYSGLINAMGEWQFARLGFYLPMISVMAWVGLAALMVWAASHLVRRQDGNDAEVAATGHRPARTPLHNALIAAGFVGGLIALAAAVNLVLLPRGTDREQVLTPASLGPGRSGAVRLQGFRVAGPMARYSEGVLMWKADLYLVPLAAPEAGPVIAFAQVTPYEAASKVPRTFRGILRQDALPGELYPLYASQGVVITERVPVLFRDSYSMAGRTLLLIGESAILAIGAFIASGVLQRRRRRMRSRAT